MRRFKNIIFNTIMAFIISFIFFTNTQSSRANELNVSIIADSNELREFNEYYNLNWKNVFYDSCNVNWYNKWWLDGKVGHVKNTPEGMIIQAGPEKNDSNHVVLWTKQSFSGDLLIEYDFTRLDNKNRQVNILYIQATGLNIGAYKTDIFEWNTLREIPAMNVYYLNMNVLHISYAAFVEKGDYIRGRRYRPDLNKGLKGTDLGVKYNTGFFEPNVPHHIIVIKKGFDLYMKVSNLEKTVIYKMNYSQHPEILKGPIGLRHMFGRTSIYKNFCVRELSN